MFSDQDSLQGRRHLPQQRYCSCCESVLGRWSLTPTLLCGLLGVIRGKEELSQECGSAQEEDRRELGTSPLWWRSCRTEKRASTAARVSADRQKLKDAETTAASGKWSSCSFARFRKVRAGYLLLNVHRKHVNYQLKLFLERLGGSNARLSNVSWRMLSIHRLR
jgi:hypothetical protein